MLNPYDWGDQIERRETVEGRAVIWPGNYSSLLQFVKGSSGQVPMAVFPRVHPRGMDHDHPGLFAFNGQRATKRERNDCGSRPLHRPPRPILQRFRQVLHFYGVGTRQVPYGPGKLEHPMKATRAERPASSSCRPCSPGPGHRRGRGGCRRVRAGRDTGRAWPAGAGRHWPRGGGCRRRFGYGQDGCVVASVGCSLLLGWFCGPKPLSQIQRSTFSPFQEASYTHSFGGFGLRQEL